MNKWLNVVGVWFCYVCTRCVGWVPYRSVPYSVSIEPTNCCNLSCLECPSGQKELRRERGMMEFKTFQRIVDEIKGSIISLTLYFQGEPFLNDSFVDMVTYAKKVGLWVETSTNAHFIDDEVAQRIVTSGLNRIIVSLDGVDAESYSTYRCGGDFNRAILGIESLVRAKRKVSGFGSGARKGLKGWLWGFRRKQPMIILQFLVFKYNEEQIAEIKALGKRLGVDKVELKTAQIYRAENAPLLLTSISKYARYVVRDGVMALKRRRRKICSRVFTNSVITWDGQVVPCCYDKDADYCVGDIREDYYVDVMRDDKRMDFIKRVIANRGCVGMCCNCNN